VLAKAGFSLIKAELGRNITGRRRLSFLWLGVSEGQHLAPRLTLGLIVPQIIPYNELVAEGITVFRERVREAPQWTAEYGAGVTDCKAPSKGGSFDAHTTTASRLLGVIDAPGSDGPCPS
jgi:hypothetical protein